MDVIKQTNLVDEFPDIFQLSEQSDKLVGHVTVSHSLNLFLPHGRCTVPHGPAIRATPAHQSVIA